MSATAPSNLNYAPAHATNVKACDGFARALADAIASGTERDIEPAVATEFATERPAVINAPPAPYDAPHPPQQPSAWAEIQARRRAERRDFAADYRQRHYGGNRPTPRRNAFTILDLADGLCRYPVSEAAPHLFCGAPAEGIYCATHAARCHTGRSP